MQDKDKYIQKIDVYIKVNDYKINNVGKLYNEYITCIDNNDNKTVVQFYITDNKLIRTNDDIEMSIDFNKEIVEYHLKKENKTAYSNIKTERIEKENNNNIKIIYNHDEAMFDLTIKYNIK